MNDGSGAESEKKCEINVDLIKMKSRSQRGKLCVERNWAVNWALKRLNGCEQLIKLAGWGEIWAVLIVV